jgi:hypothetical protein
MQLDSNGFNTFKKWFNSCANVDSSRDLRSLQVIACVLLIMISGKCNPWTMVSTW